MQWKVTVSGWNDVSLNRVYHHHTPAKKYMKWLADRGVGATLERAMTKEEWERHCAKERSIKKDPELRPLFDL